MVPPPPPPPQSPTDPTMSFSYFTLAFFFIATAILVLLFVLLGFRCLAKRRRELDQAAERLPRRGSERRYDGEFDVERGQNSAVFAPVSVPVKKAIIVLQPDGDHSIGLSSEILLRDVAIQVRESDLDPVSMISSSSQAQRSRSASAAQFHQALSAIMNRTTDNTTALSPRQQQPQDTTQIPSIDTIGTAEHQRPPLRRTNSAMAAVDSSEITIAMDVVDSLRNQIITHTPTQTDTDTDMGVLDALNAATNTHSNNSDSAAASTSDSPRINHTTIHTIHHSTNTSTEEIAIDVGDVVDIHQQHQQQQGVSITTMVDSSVSCEIDLAPPPPPAVTSTTTTTTMTSTGVDAGNGDINIDTVGLGVAREDDEKQQGGVLLSVEQQQEQQRQRRSKKRRNRRRKDLSTQTDLNWFDM